MQDHTTMPIPSGQSMAPSEVVSAKTAWLGARTLIRKAPVSGCKTGVPAVFTLAEKLPDKNFQDASIRIFVDRPQEIPVILKRLSREEEQVIKNPDPIDPKHTRPYLTAVSVLRDQAKAALTQRIIGDFISRSYNAMMSTGATVGTVRIDTENEVWEFDGKK